jgi:hypothetical protein
LRPYIYIYIRSRGHGITNEHVSHPAAEVLGQLRLFSQNLPGSCIVFVLLSNRMQTQRR